MVGWWVGGLVGGGLVGGGWWVGGWCAAKMATVEAVATERDPPEGAGVGRTAMERRPYLAAVAGRPPYHAARRDASPYRCNFVAHLKIISTPMLENAVRSDSVNSPVGDWRIAGATSSTGESFNSSVGN